MRVQAPLSNPVTNNVPPTADNPEKGQVRDKLFTLVAPKNKEQPIRSTYTHQNKFYISSQSLEIVGSRWAMGYPEIPEFQEYAARQLKCYQKIEDPQIENLVKRLLEFNKKNPSKTLDIGYDQVRRLEPKELKSVESLLDTFNGRQSPAQIIETSCFVL